MALVGKEPMVGTPGAPPGLTHTPCSPCQALTHSGDLGEEQEKIISGVERQIQGKGASGLTCQHRNRGFHASVVTIVMSLTAIAGKWHTSLCPHGFS